jgi:hypothetical protein
MSTCGLSFLLIACYSRCAPIPASHNTSSFIMSKTYLTLCTIEVKTTLILHQTGHTPTPAQPIFLKLDRLLVHFGVQ